MNIPITSDVSSREVSKLIEFLKKYGNLDSDKPPRFRADDIPVQYDSLGSRMHWYRTPEHMVHPGESGDVIFAEDFRRLGLDEMADSEFEGLIREIPNSEEYVLVDIGSHLGVRAILPFARENPLVNVFLVDRMTKGEVIRDSHYQEFKIRSPITDSVEISVNNLLLQNGHHNVVYTHRDLDGDDTYLGIEDRLKGKQVVVTGFRNLYGLGNSTTNVAIRLGAKKVLISNSALQKIPSDSPRFAALRDHVSESFTDQEVDKAIGLITQGDRYDISDNAQKMFATALHLLYAQAQIAELQKAGYNTETYRNKHNKKQIGFSIPRINLVAEKI